MLMRIVSPTILPKHDDSIIFSSTKPISQFSKVIASSEVHHSTISIVVVVNNQGKALVQNFLCIEWWLFWPQPMHYIRISCADPVCGISKSNGTWSGSVYALEMVYTVLEGRCSRQNRRIRNVEYGFSLEACAPSFHHSLLPSFCRAHNCWSW